jgi:hypothetical protein
MFARYLVELNNFWALQGVSGAEIDKKGSRPEKRLGTAGCFEAMSPRIGDAGDGA